MSVKNTRVAIIGALPEEVESIRQLGTQTTKRQSGPFIFEEFQYQGLDCLLSITGIGKVQAAMLFQHIVDTWQPDYFIFTGVAGALNSDYDTGDIVIGTEFIQHSIFEDVNKTFR